MKEYNLEYLSRNLGHLTGIPVRLYKENKEVYYYSMVGLPKDPILLNLDDILKIDDHVAFYSAPYFYYYGILNYLDYKMVIGPTRILPLDDKTANEMAFELDIEKDDLKDFITGVKLIVNMPIESLLESLCSFNYVLNDEILTVKDVMISKSPKNQFEKAIKTETYDHNIINDDKTKIVHNSFLVEKEIMNMVEDGNYQKLELWIKNAPAIRPGTLSFDYIRQQKNIFIVTATLVSRSSIKGGMDVDDALGLSDLYIQKAEMLNNYLDIYNLEYLMVLDFTKKVNELKSGSSSKLVISVSNYIIHHISEVIKLDDISSALYMSKSSLSSKFKKESGKTVDEFILEKKINEAKNLLYSTDKSLSQISLYLGFSSQSHFSRTFKKQEGISPLAYRNKN